MTKKLIVVKVGTGCLTNKLSNLDLSKMKKLVDQICEIRNLGNEIILVTFGAIASGISEIKVKPNPNHIVFPIRKS